MSRKPFGPGCELFVLRNANGLQASLTNFGATLVALQVPDRSGKLNDVVLGYDTYDGYAADRAYLGATVGRYANRIARGEFTINDQKYQLARNNDGNSLHGGLSGFNKKIWRASSLAPESSVTFECESPNGEEGYPGNLRVRVQFTLTDEDELRIDYEASTDQDTVLNLTNHSYFNLAGEGSGEICDHELWIGAERFTPVDATLIPTGELAFVAGTPFDFRSPARIGDRIDSNDQQLKVAGGYDHNWVLGDGSELRLAARASERKSGRSLEVRTTEPGLQFYAGNFLDGSIVGKSGRAYGRRHGFTLETQHYPDSPNQPSFPSTRLKAGETFRSTTIYRFATLES